MSGRLEYTNERLLISKLQSLKRWLDEMKALQRMSSRSGITFYETTSTLEYDAMVVVPYVAGSYGHIVTFDIVFTADRQEWPFALSLPKLYVSGQSGTIIGATELQRSDLDTGDPNMAMLDTPKKLKFSHFVLVENPPAGQIRYVYIKNNIVGTDKGSFTTEAYRE